MRQLSMNGPGMDRQWRGALALCCSLALSAVSASATRAQTIQPGDILLTNAEGNIQAYSSTGNLVRTLTGTGQHFVGVGVTPTGNIVATYYDDGVTPTTGVDIFNRDGLQIGTFLTPQLKGLPGDVSVFADGTLAVDDQGGAVDYYTQAGSLIQTIAPSWLTDAYGNGIGPNNLLWVADNGDGLTINGHAIDLFTEAGASYQAAVSTSGQPSAVVEDPTDGTLWIEVSPLDQIFHVDPSTGNQLGAFSNQLSDASEGLTISADGSVVYATAQSASVIDEFSPSGTLLGKIDLVGSGTHEFLTTMRTPVAPEPGTLALIGAGFAVSAADLLRNRRNRMARPYWRFPSQV